MEVSQLKNKALALCLIAIVAIGLAGCKGLEIKQMPSDGDGGQALDRLVSRVLENSKSAAAQETSDVTMPSGAASIDDRQTDEAGEIKSFDDLLKPKVLAQKSLNRSFVLKQVKVTLKNIKLARYLSDKEEIVVSFDVQNDGDQPISALRNLVVTAKQGEEKLELGNYISSADAALSRVKNLPPKQEIKDLDYAFVKASDEPVDLSVILAGDSISTEKVDVQLPLPDRKKDRVQSSGSKTVEAVSETHTETASQSTIVDDIRS